LKKYKRPIHRTPATTCIQRKTPSRKYIGPYPFLRRSVASSYLFVCPPTLKRDTVTALPLKRQKPSCQGAGNRPAAITSSFAFVAPRASCNRPAQRASISENAAMDLPSTIPIFPLPNVVLFPGVPLPLHVFEPRYRDMVRDVSVTHEVIGMALLRG